MQMHQQPDLFATLPVEVRPTPKNNAPQRTSLTLPPHFLRPIRPHPLFQLLYEVQFYAASEALPLACRRLHHVFKSAPLTVHADYLLGRYVALPRISNRPDIITYALRFPLCTLLVLSALLERPTSVADTNTNANANANADKRKNHHHPDVRGSSRPPELPRRLFRRLSTSDDADVLPLLRYLYSSDTKVLRTWPDPDADSHDGYALVRAVNVGVMPLVRFLLEHGASPGRRKALSVRLAIKRRDLALVRLLVEPPDVCPEERRRGKRRRLVDRVQVDSEMLKYAVTHGAHDTAEYLMHEKGCVPDLETLSLLRYEEPFHLMSLVRH